MKINKLRFYRINAGLSQFELAEASGVHRCHIQLAETGIRAPSMEHQKLLAECLGCVVSDLFASDERRENKNEN